MPQSGGEWCDSGCLLSPVIHPEVDMLIIGGIIQEYLVLASYLRGLHFQALQHCY